MTTLVIDVAAEHSGAITILNQFIAEFRNDPENKYIIVLSTPKYEDCDNIKFVNYEWIKKSHLHRLFFDRIYVSRLIRRYKPDRLLSLQNNAFHVNGILQEVYFQNALPISEKRFSLKESKSLWIYQNIIGWNVRRSLKWADHVTVQAAWIKRALVNKWNIEEVKISVKRPEINLPEKAEEYHPTALFYPANGSLYKNHLTLFRALKPLWEKKHAPELRLTGTKSNLPLDCQEFISKSDYPVVFMGRLSREEMIEQYASTILVFPSYIETIGLPLVEAKATGCKIIVSDCEYAHEAVGNYREADFFSSFDYKTLEDLIEKNCMNYGML